MAEDTEGADAGRRALVCHVQFKARHAQGGGDNAVALGTGCGRGRPPRKHGEACDGELVYKGGCAGARRRHGLQIILVSARQI